MKVMITGANGQLGEELVFQLSNSSFEIYSFTRAELDITNQDKVNALVEEVCPDVIINAAAYTKVDLAESNEESAFAINAWGQQNLAVAAEKFNARICYISTDYVFDGNSTVPYCEHDVTNPLGVYGKSKLMGEELTIAHSSKYFIVRTAWLYGQYGNNFVHTMFKLAKEKDKIGVVRDQFGSPTYTFDLVKFIIELIQSEKYGIYHATNSGECSWYEFAKAIFEEAGIAVNVLPLKSEDFPTVANRPAYSVLDNSSILGNEFQPLRSWRIALREFINKNVSNNPHL